MSTNLSAAFIAAFSNEVKQAYQGMMKLNNTVRTKNNVVGSTYRFPKIGKGLAQPRIPQSDVIPMNIQHTNATATLEDWAAPEYTDIFDQEKVNFDEKRALVEVISGAIGRRADQIIIDAMIAASGNTVDVNVGGSNTPLNIEKLRATKRYLDAAGVPSSDRTFVLTAIGLEQLLSDNEVVNSDYAAVKALVNGEINTYMGFKFIMIEDRDEGGLPLATNVRKNFAYHKAAVGLAIGKDMKTEINYVPEKTSWLSAGLYSAGAISIDTAGIVQVNGYEA